MSCITLSVSGKTATLTIQRPEKRNAFTQAMWQQLADYCDELEQQIKPRLLLVTAAGDQAFSAGADIEELASLIADPAQLAANTAIVQQAQLKLQRLSCATIAVINGLCVGGGMGIALCCDIRLAAEHARFAITPSKLGLLYSIEDSRRLVNSIGEARAKWLLYSGQMIDAATALQWGLLHQVVSAPDLAQTAADYGSCLLKVSAVSVRGIKQTLAYLGGDPDYPEQRVRPLFAEAFEQQDFKQAAAAFINKQQPEFD